MAVFVGPLFYNSGWCLMTTTESISGRESPGVFVFAPTESGTHDDLIGAFADITTGVERSTDAVETLKSLALRRFGVLILSGHIADEDYVLRVRQIAPDIVILATEDTPGIIRSLADISIESGDPAELSKTVLAAVERHKLLREYHYLKHEVEDGDRAWGEEPASLADVERQHIQKVLLRMGGNITRSAKLLEIDRATLYNKIRRYNLHR